jgi:hypothetical protein
MKLARYWTRQTGEAIGPSGHRIRAVARGWSDESLAAAGAVARDIAQRVAQKLLSGERKRGHYLYGDRPLPEPILHEFPGGAWDPRAVIARNVYGALAMNARDLMFADVDREGNSVLNEIQRVATAANVAARVYRTAAGYRVLIANFGFQARSPQSEALMRQFGADPLYVRLCQMRQSFRARLTPKPWRCDSGMPPVSFPFESPGEAARFREWDSSPSHTSPPGTALQIEDPGWRPRNRGSAPGSWASLASCLRSIPSIVDPLPFRLILC